MEFSKTDIFFITGASSGLGKAIAKYLNSKGATVVAVGRDLDRLTIAKNESQYPEHFHVKVKEFSDDIENLSKWMIEISKEFGKLKGLVLSAGVQHISPLQILSIQESKKLFDVNYFANLALVKGFCNRRVNSGVGSSIVFISSIASAIGSPGIINYSGSKGAINAAMRSVASEVSRLGIRVNSILPGFVKTEMNKNHSDVYTNEMLEKMDSQYPLGLGQVDDIVGPVSFLLSNSAKWITGSEIVVDGGHSLR